MVKGNETLGLQLDSFTPLPAPRQTFRAVAVGSSALEGLVRKEFSCEHVQSLRELVTLADAQLGLQSGLISVIQVRAAERVFDATESHQSALVYSLVQSLILTKKRSPKHYDIKYDAAGEALLAVTLHGDGSAQTTPRLPGQARNRRIQCAPFSDAYPLQHLVEARSAYNAPHLYIAATGLELETSLSDLAETERHIFALAEAP